jgi:predicted nucleotidyltransferase
MRKTSSIDALFPRTRQGILVATMMQPDRWWYLTDLAKHLGTTPSSLQRELSTLTRAGILRRRKEGNRVYFQADPDCPFQAELRGLITKTAGLVDILRQALMRFSSGVDLAFVYGSVARSDERSSSDVDLLVVGEVSLRELTPALRAAEGRLNRPVNASVYNRREFSKKVRAGNHFLGAVLGGERLFVVGGESELAEIAG